MRRIARMPMLALFLFLLPCGATYALNSEQCLYFSVKGKTAICHATGSAKNPFVLLYISDDACINGHADHAEDFVAINGTCQGGACLPVDSPCDATLPCCDGSACSNGTCQASDNASSSDATDACRE